MALVNLSAFEFLDVASTSDRFLTAMYQKSPALITGLLRKTIYKNTFYRRRRNFVWNFSTRPAVSTKRFSPV